MKKSIVFKWFVLMALLFSTMLLFIGIAQNYFFEKYYINEKSDALKTYMNEYSDTAAKKGVEATSREFYKNNHVWITKLDQYGRLCDVRNYYIEVKLNNESQDNLRIPMYSFQGAYSSDVLSLLEAGEEMVIDTVNISGERIPYNIWTDSIGVVNVSLAFKLNGPDADKAYSQLEVGILRGTIAKAVFPEHAVDIQFPYNEQYFLEQIKEFQARLLADDAKPLQHMEEYSATENFAEYKIIIKPVIENGVTEYIFAMTSLQPVNEAISVMWQFYPYILGVAFLCVIVLAFILIFVGLFIYWI